MPSYIAPRRDMRFVLYELLRVEDELAALPPHAELSRDLIDDVLEEGGKFTAEVLSPLNQVGDALGCQFQDGVVTTPPGFKEAYRQFCEAGWPSVSADPAYGGQGLPHVVGCTLSEMANAANLSFAMYPSLTHGAYDALSAHGTDEQKRLYLPKLVSGAWTGTMCLTEPQCGTDLGLVRCKAEPSGAGSYKITGTKIFVSSGEQDISENIVHLVLARLLDAPPGTKGLSLFIVPKFVPDQNGEAGERNGVRCGSIEHKMGIHGNSTCVLNFEDATGWMVGQPNRGLQAMFVMMNGARLGVGVQGLGLTEVAYQNALAYAKERLQSRSLSGPKAPSKSADPIIVHADVRRMLLTQKAYVEAGRAFAYWIALSIDKAASHPDPDVRRECEDLVSLLTPVVKAFLTDNAVLCTNLALQVFGGHGYIREGGVEQYVRDARIGTIYEGTNTIQSLDLLGRKVLLDKGAKLLRFGALVKSFIEREGRIEAMAEFVGPLESLVGEVERLTVDIGIKAMHDPDEAGAAAVDYLRVVGHLAYAYFWARMARIAIDKEPQGDTFYAAKLFTARFYFQRVLPEAKALIESARAGARSLFELDAESF
jgi:alkylation response protein AidB-like acyl-CoA dehydrogenase